MARNDKFDYYILKKQYQSFGYENIINLEGETVAKILFPLYHPNHLVELQEVRSNSVFFIQKNRSLFHKKYVLIKSSNDVHAIIRVRKQPQFKNIASLETIKGLEKYFAVGNLKKWSYHIIDESESIIAQVYNLKNSKIIPEHINEVSKHYCIKIASKKMPIILISFVMTINNLSYHGIANIAGIERRIARLRPFGPRKV
ncbi:MAG: hypothetical protein ACFFEY_15720 [Candidatus Thorarchaeota archaeon]